MRLKLYCACFFVMLFFVNSEAIAAVCKIVDERGQTTYTEKQSCGDSQTMRVESHGFTLDASAVSHSIPFNSSSPHSKGLIFTGLDYYKNHFIDPRTNVGKYLVGSDCVGNAPIFWRSLQEQHATFLPEKEVVLSNLSRQLERYGYQATSNVNVPLNTSYGTLLVSGNVVNLKIEACANNSRLIGMQWDGESIPSADFRTSIVKVDVDWSVYGSDGELIHEFESVGYFDSRVPRSSQSFQVRSHVEAAIQNAFFEMLSITDFAELLKAEALVASVVGPSKPIETETFSLQGKVLLLTIAAMVVLIVLKRLVDLLK